MVYAVFILIFLLGITAGALLFLLKSKNNADTENKLKLEFENIAAKIMDEKSQKLTELSRQSLDSVINPFKEKMEDFKNKVDEVHRFDTAQRAVFSTELKHLMELNKQVSAEANNLAAALKGENKTQGNWGEKTLEKIFEAAGMIKGVHYAAQERFETESGVKIPDYIINLPEDKNIIVDSKVSLTAYEKYFNTENPEDSEQFLQEHAASIKKHITDLSKKDYVGLDLTNPEYVLMFIPLDGALSEALKAKPDLQDFAFSKNIVMVTPSTLLAVLKTVAYIWRQENQKKNVLEIARQGGILYDKFVSFTQVLKDTQNSIENANKKCTEAIKRLSESDKKGDSLTERAAKLKELGINSKKILDTEN
jgi:DNA recombination protein RmuC